MRYGSALLIAAAFAAITGCDTDAAHLDGLANDPDAARALVAAVDDPWTTLEMLSNDAGLPYAAAARLVRWRDGEDGRPRTADDRRFGSLDAVTRIGGLAGAEAARASRWALDRGWAVTDDPTLGRWDDVEFTRSDAAATLALANTAPFEVLDVDARVRADAVRSIVLARPIDHVEDLADLDRVGPAAMRRLKAYAQTFAEEDPAPCPQAPLMTRADATSLDFHPREFTLCTPADAEGGCAAADALDAGALVLDAAGAPLFDTHCQWQAAPTCGPFPIAETCCYTLHIDAACGA